MPDDKVIKLLNKYHQDGKYTECLPLIDKLLADTGLSEEQTALWIFRKGFSQGKVGKPKDSIKTYGELWERFKDSKNEEVQIQVAKAMFSKGVSQGQAGKPEDKIKTYGDLWENFKESGNEDVQVIAAQAMLNKGDSQGQAKEYEEAIKTYSELFKDFKDLQNQKVQVIVAQAMLNKGDSQGQAKEYEEAIKTYSELFKDFKDSQNQKVQVVVAQAMLNKGILQEKAEKDEDEDAIKTYGELFERFKESKNEEVQVIVAQAMLNKGILQKSEDKIKTYGDLWERFKDSQNEEVQIPVALAMYNKGEILLKDNKFEEAVKDFKRYLEIRKLPHGWDCLTATGNFEQRAKLLYALISIYEKCYGETQNRHNQVLPAKIFHFTDIKALYSILDYEKVKDRSRQEGKKEDKDEAGNILRGYNAIYMNDPSEGRALVEYSHKHKDKGQDIPDLTKFFKDREFNWIEHDAAKSVYSISFTAADDSLSLWRAYGRDGRGVCIVIPTNTLKPMDGKNNLSGDFTKQPGEPDSFSEITSKIEGLSSESANVKENDASKSKAKDKPDYKAMPENLYKVRYIGKSEKFDCKIADEFLKSLNEHIKLISKTKKDIEDNELIERINHAVREAFAGALYLFKDEQYAAEEEYRMITLRRLDDKDIFFDEREVPHLYLKTRPFVFEDPKTEVILGPGVEDPEAVALSIQRILQVNPKFKNDIEVKYSKVNYRPAKV